MIKKLKEFIRSLRQRSKLYDLKVRASLMSTHLRQSYLMDYCIEAELSYELEIFSEDVAELTASNRVRLASQVHRFLTKLRISEPTINLAVKLTDVAWVKRALAMPVQQRLRFMMAETDDSKKYTVKR